MNIFIDIETIPQQPEAEAKAAIAETIKAPAQMKKQETIDSWHNGEGKYAGEKDAAIEDQYRKTSFDGGKGEVISVAVSDGEIASVSYREEGMSESMMVRQAFSYIHSLLQGRGHENKPFFVGHNVQFDLGFLWKRAVILNINPGFKLPFGGRHNSNFFCTMQAWAGFNKTISQDNLSKALGLPPKPDDIDGSKVWDHYKAGNIKRIAEYNQQDVETVMAIYNRIKFVAPVEVFEDVA